jgi:hypothetical protein
MATDPAEEDQAPYTHKDLVQHDPILWAQTIEARCKARVAMALLCQPANAFSNLRGLLLGGCTGGD